MCAQSGVAPCLSTPRATQRGSRHVRDFFFPFFLKIPQLPLPKPEKKKRDGCQNSLSSPNVQTAAISSFHPSSAEDLMRSQSRVCPDHRFKPQPVAYLSAFIELMKNQSASSLSFSICRSFLSFTCLPANFFASLHRH